MPSFRNTNKPRNVLPRLLPENSHPTLPSPDDASDAVEAESRSSGIVEAQPQVEQTINQQSTDIDEAQPQVEQTINQQTTNMCIPKSATSDVAIDVLHDLEPEEKHDPVVTLMDSVGGMSLSDQTSDVAPIPKPSEAAAGAILKTSDAATGAIPKIPKGPTGAKSKTPKSSTGAIPKTSKSSIGTATTIRLAPDEMFKKGSYSVGGIPACKAETRVGGSKRKQTRHANDPGLPARTTRAVEPNTNTDLVPRPTPDYFLKSDEHFPSHASASATYSDQKREIPRNQQERIDKLLDERCQPDPDTFNINEMMAKYELEFPLWMVILQQGFNLMLHGMGSKRVLLDSFCRKQLINMRTVVVQGFLPYLTVEHVIDDIAKEIHRPLAMANTHRSLEKIVLKLTRSPDIHLYLLVHNLDGEAMRNESMQMVLCQLATMPNVHIVATIDSISAPSMWDTSLLGLFNFSWRKVITMVQDATETPI